MPNEQEQEFKDAFEEAVSEDEGRKPTEDDSKKKDQEDELENNQNDQDDDDDQPDNTDQDEVFKPTPDEDQASKDEDKSQQEDKPCANCEALQAELSKEQQKTSSWDGRIRAANDRADALQKELDELKARGDKPGKEDTSPESEVSEEDDEVLEKFKEEFPDLVKPLEIMAKRKADQEVAHRMKDIEPKIQSLEKKDEETSATEHLKAITDAHSDWREIRDSGKLRAWIDAQPSFLRTSLEKVFSDGSTQEVIEMFDTFKRVHSIPTDNPKPNKEDASTKNADDLLAVEGSSGGPPAGKPDNQDFDAGWKDANS